MTKKEFLHDMTLFVTNTLGKANATEAQLAAAASIATALIHTERF